MECPKYDVVNVGVFDSTVIYPNTAISPLRTATRYEIEFVPNANGAVSFINGHKYPLENGFLICAKPGDLRQTTRPYKCFYIHLVTEDPQLMDYLDKLPECYLPVNSVEISRKFHEILKTNMLNLDVCTRLKLQSQVSDLLYCLNSDLLKGESIFKSALYTHQKSLLAIERYIREHPQENLELIVLSEMANLSPIYFHKIFTEYFGKTPTEYVLNCRISTAKMLLLTSGSAMNEIAEKCGFSSQSYFNCKFKEAVGISPLQYKKKMLALIKV